MVGQTAPSEQSWASKRRLNSSRNRGSGKPRALFGIRELLTGLDHFVGYNCLRELIRKKAVLQGRVRETTEEALPVPWAGVPCHSRAKWCKMGATVCSLT